MNLRILKKKSKQALRYLGHYELQGKVFEAERGGNYHGMIVRCNHRRKPLEFANNKRGRCDFCDYHPLHGTPMTGEVRGYYEPEWEERTAYEELCNRIQWGDRPAIMSDDDWNRALKLTRTTPIDIGEFQKILDEI